VQIWDRRSCRCVYPLPSCSWSVHPLPSCSWSVDPLTSSGCYMVDLVAAALPHCDPSCAGADCPSHPSSCARTGGSGEARKINQWVHGFNFNILMGLLSLMNSNYSEISNNLLGLAEPNGYTVALPLTRGRHGCRSR
jgi:hypothetical protein